MGWTHQLPGNKPEEKPKCSLKTQDSSSVPVQYTGLLTSEMILPLSFREEAKKIWEKREEEWEREKAARDHLMNEVMMTSVDDVCPLTQ